jgi:large subunit ribosomal protein L30
VRDANNGPADSQRDTAASQAGLKLNRIGRIADLPDTPQTRGMIAKVAHLVRIIGQETELDCFVRAIRNEYHELVTKRVRRGKVLWAQFEAAVEACRANPKGDDRQITEKVNEMAVAKMLLEDEAITWPITYEPDLLPDGRKIDFVVDRGADNLYIEVKTVRPRTADTEDAWQKFAARRRHHPDNVHFIVEMDGRRHLRERVCFAVSLSRLHNGFRDAPRGCAVDQARSWRAHILRHRIRLA